MTSPTAIVAYLALFTGAGFSFLFINLLVGKFLRPKAPNVEKLEVYECGEPTIGSSFVQFDIRFYVVALLFIIFDVEVAFFFPWATVYGKATHLMDPNLSRMEASLDPQQPTSPGLTPAEADLYRELGVAPKAPAFNQDMVGKNVDVAALTPYQKDRIAVQSTARNLAKLSIVDIGAFFAILLVGFAYVWKRGDLDWVRAVDREAATVGDELVDQPEPVLSG